MRHSLAVFGLAAAATASVQHEASAATIVKFATTLPDTSVTVIDVIKPWVDEINKAANGEFEIQLFGPTFATTTNVMDRVVSGVADMGILVIPATGIPFHRTLVTTLPMVGGDSAASSVALWKLYEKGLLADEFARTKLMALAVLPPNTLISRKEIRTLDDMKGLKVRANDKNGADALSALGASPSFIPATEAYQALSKGVVDAAVSNPGTIQTFRYNELAHNHVENVSFGAIPTAFVLNKAFYDGLSPSAKAVFDKFTGEATSKWIGAAYGASDARIVAKFSDDKKYRLITIEPAELAKWRALTATVEKGWMERTPDGAQVLEAFKQAYDAALKAK
nr:TRAP transporter substrate-binding protein [Alsobacter ponti]